MNVLDLLCSNGFIVLNKQLIKEIGLNESIILGLFASKQNFNKDWFYCTYEEIETETTLTKYFASKAIDNLINKKIILTKNKGVPKKKYYFIDEKSFINLDKIDNNNIKNTVAKGAVFDLKRSTQLTSRSEPSSSLEVNPVNDIIYSNNTYNNNTYNNNTYNTKQKKCATKVASCLFLKELNLTDFNEEEILAIERWINFRSTEYRLKKSEHAIKVVVNHLKAVKQHHDILKVIDYFMNYTTMQNITMINVNHALKQKNANSNN